MTHTRGSAPRPTVGIVTPLAAWLVASAPIEVAAQSQRTLPQAPDLSATWLPSYCIPDGLTCPFDIEAVKLTPRAVKFMNEFDEAISPKYDCVPANTPGIIADPYLWEIEQRPGRVIFRYEKDDVIRTVWTDGRGHPHASERSVQGHSIGWYDGDELVVETANFTYDPIGFDDMAGLPSSTLKVVTERYRLAGERLTVNVTVEDPLYLEELAGAYFEWERTDIEMLPYDCDPEKARQPIQFLPE